MPQIKNQPTIRIKLLRTFALFTFLALVALMLFQGLFVDEFYQRVKISDMKRVVHEYIQAQENPEPSQNKYWSEFDEVGLYVFDENGILDESDFPITYHGRTLSKDVLMSAYQAALQNNGEYFARQTVKPDELNGRFKGDKGKPLSGDKPLPPKETRNMDVVLYGELLQTDNGERMVLAVSNVTPVDAVARTLSVQSLVAAGVIMLLAGVLALQLAKTIASPIEELNRSAKGLADGTYQPPEKRPTYLEAVQLQNTMDQVNVDLRKTDELHREFIANISHDLRTPLTMIRGYSEALRDLPSDDPSEDLQVIIDETIRLNELVDDLLSLSKLNAGTVRLETERLELSAFLREIVNHLADMTRPDGYVLSFEGEGEMWVDADPVRLSQAVYNLVYNAIRHCGDDRAVKLRLSTHDRVVKVECFDHGEGIEEEDIPHIWERYYCVRKGDADASKSVGSGLGLSIVQSVIHLHNGQCGVVSVRGEGSNFWFELPLAE